MTPEAQRIAIAEACGWTDCHIGSAGIGGAVERRGRPKGTPPKRKYTCDLPDYLNNLNAIHEAVQYVRDNDMFWTKYNEWLIKICGGYKWEAISATSSQRAEAFLRTIGKWDDSK